MLFRSRRREKLARELGSLQIPKYANPLNRGGAQEVLDRLVALHANVRARAGLPPQQNLALDKRINDLTKDLMAANELYQIEFVALQHIRAVRDRTPFGSAANGDEALAELFARDVQSLLKRLKGCYSDVF